MSPLLFLLFRFLCSTKSQTKFSSLNCSQTNPCQNTTLSFIDNGTCTLYCNDRNSCKSSTVVSSTTEAFRLYCYGKDSCSNMHFTGTAGQIGVHCNGERSCFNMHISIQLSKTSTSNIYCGFYNESCHQLNVNISSNVAASLQVICGYGDKNLVDSNDSPLSIPCSFTKIYCSIPNCDVHCIKITDEIIPSYSACNKGILYCSVDSECIVGTGDRQISYSADEFVIITPYFKADPELRSWYDAEQFCITTFHTHLASIITDDDYMKAMQILPDQTNAWIGLNNINQIGWSWIDGHSCDYVNESLCENDKHWRTGLPNSQPGKCALINGTTGIYNNDYCNNTLKIGVLCNNLPNVDYICVSKNNNLTHVLEYKNFYLYNDPEAELIWNLDDSVWYLIINNITIGNCSSYRFMLPYNCDDWLFTNSSYSILPCSFEPICLTHFLNVSFQFSHWNYTENAPVYQDVCGRIMNPITTDDLSRGYLLRNDSTNIAICVIHNPLNILFVTQCTDWTILLSHYYDLIGDIQVTYICNPSNNPTSNPSNAPGRYPTNSPLTLIPTQPQSTFIISKNTHFLTTATFSESEVLMTKNDVSSDGINNTINNLNYVFELIVLFLLSVFSILIIYSYIHSKYIDINHFFQLSSLISISAHLMDLSSDIFFAILVNIYIDPNDLQILIIYLLSICFILIPIITTIIQLFRETSKHWLKKDKLRAWLSEHNKLLYFIGIISGSSFASVELFNSNLFSLSIFDMGLNKKELLRYKIKRVYSIILLENIPQLTLQIWFIGATSGSYDLITLTSLTFSLISIIVHIMTMITHKKILFDQELIIIQYDVCGKVIISNIRKANRKHKLQRQLALLLGISKNLIEIERPSHIPNGLNIQFNIHINNYNKDTLDKYEELMENSISNGQLAEIMKISWCLNSVPTISNLKHHVKHSKKAHRLNCDQIELNDHKQ